MTLKRWERLLPDELSRTRAERDLVEGQLSELGRAVRTLQTRLQAVARRERAALEEVLKRTLVEHGVLSGELARLEARFQALRNNAV